MNKARNKYSSIYGDLKCYGAKNVETPHVDKLASEGIRFTNGSCRGGHITAFNSSLQKKMGIDIDAAEIVRRLVAWGQGRMDERLLWMFARKCGDCMDWAIDIAGKHDTNVTLWEGYYKGPTYTEFPVTHFFYNKNINLDYTYGNSEGIGNVALMPCFEEELKKAGVTLMYRTPAVQFIQDRKSVV